MGGSVASVSKWTKEGTIILFYRERNTTMASIRVSSATASVPTAAAPPAPTGVATPMRKPAPMANSIAKGLFKRSIKKGNKDKKGKAFTLHHCYAELESCVKWKSRDTLQIPNFKKGNVTNIDDDEASSEDGKISTTPHSTTGLGMPEGRKVAKEKAKKKPVDKDIKVSLDAMVKHRTKMNGERKAMKIKEAVELKVTATRQAVAEERLVATNEQVAETELRKVAMEEKKFCMEEQILDFENEQRHVHGHKQDG
ncbi:hypothetical protein D1007_42714 [Hordeum vulgare]|nr:hypothetical protein D1007_42714 [Hordeum vulgare]